MLSSTASHVLNSLHMNDQTVWVIEDGEAYTLLRPEDY
jgi:hypothetical protein